MLVLWPVNNAAHELYNSIDRFIKVNNDYLSIISHHLQAITVSNYLIETKKL